MHIDWTIGAADCLRETLDYWVEHNGSVAYSNKILDEVLKVEKEIARRTSFFSQILGRNTPISQNILFGEVCNLFRDFRRR